MTKAIIVKGCKDCPYKFEWFDMYYYCGYKNTDGNPITVDPNSDIPHPDCKLNDLPEPWQIEERADIRHPYDKEKNAGFKRGASWVIEQISK